MSVLSEKRNGLISKYILKCKICGIEKEVSTDRENSDDLCVNTAAVFAKISTGCGYSQMTQQQGIMNIPQMSRGHYMKNYDKVASSIFESSQKTFEEAAAEEARLVREVGDVDDDGIPIITVVTDGAWCRRWYETNYDALSGVACIVGAKSGKLLFAAVRNKYCPICERTETKKLEPREHKCYKNWSGPSTGKESDIILEGFKCSVEMLGLKYARIVGDGDSSVFRKVCQEKPYEKKHVTLRISFV